AGEQITQFQTDSSRDLGSCAARPAVQQHLAVIGLTNAQAWVFVVMPWAAGFPLPDTGLLYLVQPAQHFLQASRSRQRRSAVLLNHGGYSCLGLESKGQKPMPSRKAAPELSASRASITRRLARWVVISMFSASMPVTVKDTTE